LSRLYGIYDCDKTCFSDEDCAVGIRGCFWLCDEGDCHRAFECPACNKTEFDPWIGWQDGSVFCEYSVSCKKPGKVKCIDGVCQAVY